MGIKDRLKNEKGLTLIEVLASVAILLIVLGIGMAALMQSSVLTSKVQGESQDRQDMQVGLLELTKAVQSATDIKKGADNNNFEIVDADNRTSKYQLVNGQLNSDSKDGQTKVEGIQKMTIQDGKGITLEIEDLEEPVVLATRGGGVIATGLNEKEEWELRDADVICRNGVFEYNRYPQFGEISKIKKWGQHDTIQCDKENGILTFYDQSQINLTNGDIRIDTNKIVFKYDTDFSLSNGNVYLPYTQIIDASNQNDINIPNGKLYVGGEVKLDFNSHLITGDDITINGNLVLPNVKNTVASGGNLFVTGDAILGQNLNLTVAKDFIIQGKLNYSVSSISNVKISGDLNVAKDATFGFSYSHTLGGNIRIGGRLNINNSSKISSVGDIFVDKDTKIDYKGKIESGGTLYLNGSVTNANEVELKSKNDLIINGNLINPYQNVLDSGKNIYINGYAKIGQNSTIKSIYAFVVYDEIILGQDVKFTSGDSIHIKGRLQTGRGVKITTNNILYVADSLVVEPLAKIDTLKNSYINGTIMFPSNPGDIQGAYFHTGETLTWTGKTSGSLTENGRALIKSKKDTKVSSIDISPALPKFPLYQM
ncbi:prepilin-type N-terminal cleavage/methylation domain-containing protein [Alkalicoccobacillus gibsonii]|uniref:prepilin-type N-terminal cleavage/methylation domain-containing protein n=1 Tax=Alkalicoccobacillus gibsonii TaxID=79881 RepID=UPI003F7B683B